MRLPKRAAASGARVVVQEAPDLHAETDDELLARVRGGDDLAFGELFNRHSDAVRTFCRRTYGSTVDADDLTAETFFRVLQAVRRGTAQIEFVRAYLYTVSRRVAMEWTSRRRDVPVDDDELTRRSTAAADGTAGSAERHLITRAFTSLPERWRAVLWRVEVEGERPAVIAGHFGLSPNATAALARRAREGLRAAYLQAHLAEQQPADGSVTCRSVVEKLGAFTAGGVRGAEARRITAHLGGCASCTALHTELAEVCSGLRANASYLGPVAGLGTAGGHAGLFAKFVLVAGRAKVAAVATAVAGAGAVGLLAGPAVHGGALGQHLSAAPDNGRGSDRVVTVCTGCTPGVRGPLALPRPPHPVPVPPPHGPAAGPAGPAGHQDTVHSTHTGSSTSSAGGNATGDDTVSDGSASGEATVRHHDTVEAAGDSSVRGKHTLQHGRFDSLGGAQADHQSHTVHTTGQQTPTPSPTTSTTPTTPPPSPTTPAPRPSGGSVPTPSRSTYDADFPPPPSDPAPTGTSTTTTTTTTSTSSTTTTTTTTTTSTWSGDSAYRAHVRTHRSGYHLARSHSWSHRQYVHHRCTTAHPHLRS